MDCRLITWFDRSYYRFKIGSDRGDSGRTDQADITIYGTAGTATTKGDSFMSIVNAGVTADGLDYDHQILSTLYSVDDFYNDVNRISQETQGLLPEAWNKAEFYDLFGSSSISADFNGDNSSDVAVGSPGEGWVLFPKLDSYMWYLGVRRMVEYAKYLSGNDSWPGYAEAGDEFGAALAAGDFDNDGFDDLVVGVPGESIGSRNNAGLVMVTYGSSNGLENPENIYQNTPVLKAVQNPVISSGLLSLPAISTERLRRPRRQCPAKASDHATTQAPSISSTDQRRYHSRQ
ncbi:MAG: hypothetical protein CM15mP49_11150 [Actinomycetota bacterium]|nr:MAG: hypothetical protein CM15mP49_11150 [Actinomycetota bacterium]